MECGNRLRVGARVLKTLLRVGVCVSALLRSGDLGPFDLLNSEASSRLVAPYRAILRYYRCDTIAAIPQIARYCLREVSTPPKWCDTPPLVLSFTQAHLRDTPFCNVLRDNCAISHKKNKHEIILRYYRYRYRAI